MQNYSIGVDLGGTNLRIAAVDETGKLIEKMTLGTEVKRGRDFVIKDMCDSIESLTTKYKGSGELHGIGIGVPGFIDMEAGMVMASPNLADWTKFPVRDVIEKRLGTKVILENDANVGRHGREVAGRRTRRRTHGHVHAGHRRGRRRGLQWPLVARHDRHGRRAGTLQHLCRRQSLRMRQPRLPGAVRVGYGRGAHGAGRYRPRGFLARDRSACRTIRCSSLRARSTTSRSRGTLPPSASSRKWDARWGSASARWSTR